MIMQIFLFGLWYGRVLPNKQMMTQTDKQLITRFTKHDDQAAFSDLVKRYVDVAYAAAIACLGKDDLARDACQLTFVELARKAKHFSAGVKLGGWVYSTSRNISRKILRGEMRRQQREQHYADQMKKQHTPEIDWSRVTPEIHEALEELKETDRETIILRFFQHKSLPEVGEALGLSADAARMRLNRALDRLGGQLERKGICSTATALAGVLPVHAAVTAPAGLASLISTSAPALAGTASLSMATLTSTAIVIMKTKTLILAASLAVVAAIGTSVYKTAGSKADPQNSVPPAATTSAPIESPISEEAIEPANISELISPEKKPATISDTSETEPQRPPIDPEILAQAEQLYTIMEAGAGGGIMDMLPRTDPASEAAELTKKLQLRIGLNEEQTALFHSLLEANATARIGPDPSEIIHTIMALEKEKVIDLMALGMMGNELTPEQREYMMTLEKTAKAITGDQSTEMPETWEKNEELQAQLKESLDPTQQAELDKYIEEQIHRKAEKKAYRRSNDIADMLGLNEADRSALYDYLYENPTATNKDIAEQLSPELRELFKTKSRKSFLNR